ncbi:MAG TPA: hypothetical protein PKV41_02345, partial [Candidatus Omnitrophota bacterium]|nr:hypothetical protein [Candidatus Omnitrophota bacterium]
MRATPDLYKHILIIAVLVVITALAFSPCLRNSFVINWDDDVHLLANEKVRSLTSENIASIFTQLINRTYQPLLVLSYAVEYHFFQYRPFVYHLTNLLLHIAVVGLVYKLALSLSLEPLAAGISALIFGLHPVHVEPVAWVTSRKDLLYSLFYLLSVILYLRYLRRRSFLSYGGSLACALLAIFSKSMALSLPLVLWAMDWFQRRKMDWKILGDKIEYFLLIVPIAWITYSQNTGIMSLNRSGIRSGVIYLWSFMHYVFKFFWPVNFTPIHEMSGPIALANSVYLWPLLVFGILIILLVRFRRDRLFVFAFVFYFASIFFLLRTDVIVFGAQMVSDRWVYLPCLGFCLWLGERFWKIYLKMEGRRWIKAVWIFLLVGVFSWLGISSFKQCRIWKDGGTLWEYALKHYPQSPVANNNMADFLLKRGETGQKIAEYCRRSIEAY